MDSLSDPFASGPLEVLDVYISANLTAQAAIFDRTTPVAVFFRTGRQSIWSTIEFVLKNKFNAVIVAARQEDDWFQYPDFNECLAAVRDVISSFSRIVVSGSSQCGFAALMSSRLLGAHAVLAFSPQVAIGAAAPRGETRWRHHWSRLLDNGGVLYANAAEHITMSGDIFVTYDPRDLDALHVEMISAVRPVNRILVPGTGHSTLAEIASSGLSPYLFRELLAGTLNRREAQAKIYAARRISLLRLTTLIAKLSKRGRAVPRELITRVARHEKADAKALREAALAACAAGAANELEDIVKRLVRSSDYISAQTAISDCRMYARSLSPQQAARLAKATWPAPDLSNPPPLYPLLVAALFANRGGDFELARGAVTQAALSMTAWDERNRDLLTVCAELGLEGECQQFMRRLEIGPLPSFADQRELAALASAGGFHVEAVRILTKAASFPKEAWRVAVEGARGLIRLQQYKEALTVLKPWIDVSVPDPRALSVYGEVLTKLGRHAESAAILERAIKTNPKLITAYLSLATSLKQLGQLDDAIEVLTRAFLIEPYNQRVGKQRDQFRALKEKSSPPAAPA